MTTFPVDRNALLVLASDALAEDWGSEGGPLTRLGPGAVDFRQQLAIVRDDTGLLGHVLKGIGLYTFDDAQEPDGRRPVWFELSPDRENAEIARHDLAVAQSALSDKIRKHRELISSFGDGGAGLEHVIQLDRIRSEHSLRESVLPALEFYRRTIRVGEEDRPVWFRWQEGDPPTAFSGIEEDGPSNVF